MHQTAPLEVDFGVTEQQNLEIVTPTLKQLPTLLRLRGYTVAVITQLSPHSATIQRSAGLLTLFEQAWVMQESQTGLNKWKSIYQLLESEGFPPIAIT